MNKLMYSNLILVTIIIIIWISGCSDSNSTGPSGPAGYSAGSQITFALDGVIFKMVYVPAKKFPLDTTDNDSASVSKAFLIGETEVTYALWNTVYSWATDVARGANCYYFQNTGTIGNFGTGSVQQPVTIIDWRDAMVWCNAATEWYKTKVDTNCACVYRNYGDSVIIRDSRDANANECDSAIVIASARGFRLLSSKEWELAARYKSDRNNDGDIRDSSEFYPGKYASGAFTYYDDMADVNPANGVVDGKDANDTVAVYRLYYNGGWFSTGVTGTAPVRSKKANALGLYDMSGNVWEWCFDLAASSRVLRGGSWYNSANAIVVSFSRSDPPETESSATGFRIALQ